MRHVLLIAIAMCVLCTNRWSPLLAQEQPTGEKAKLLRDMHDLMNITVAIHDFASEHDGLLPASLGETLPYIEDRTSWTENEKRKATPVEKARLYLSSHEESQSVIPEPVTAAWVDEHTSYIYLAKPGAKLSDYPDLSQTVIAHGSPDAGYAIHRKNEGETVVYPLAMLDGHAESHPKKKLRELLTDSPRK